MYTLDIHSCGETIPVAISKLETGLSFARRDKDKLLCLITGYGSTGKTHKIKTAVLEYLEENKGKKFKDYILGSDLDIFFVKYQSFKYGNRIPESEKRLKNPGCIYIIL